MASTVYVYNSMPNLKLRVIFHLKASLIKLSLNL